MTWNGPETIRRRREQLGLSQAEVAASLSVSKSYLSLVEAGKRSLAFDQVKLLSHSLQMPEDLLILGVGKLPDDINRIIETAAPTVVAALRQRVESHPIDILRAPTNPPESITAKGKRISVSSIPELVSVTKGNAAYRAHSYHTKIPPDAITPFIKAFTRQNELVLDPFCGSGMTGVAALRENRNALLSDLSPAAVHIARNYTTWCDPREFLIGLEAVKTETISTVDWLYRPVGGKGIVEYTTWSDIFACPTCFSQFEFWEAIQRGDVGNNAVKCPKCRAQHRKFEFNWVGETPVLSQTSAGSRRIDSHLPTSGELALISEASRAPIPYWIPDVAFGNQREMWRASHTAMGIFWVADFFTRRNLHALANLRHSIVENSTGRVREALLFAFTACVNRASKRYQWNAKRPTNVMTGTLYISSMRYEWNVWSLFERKAKDVLRYFERYPSTDCRAQVFQKSATKLDSLHDSSVDMVFMDPPFGSNIFYADASLLWESWLGECTEESAEIVINKHVKSDAGGKSLNQYASLMTAAFSEASRVLKLGGRGVLAFSNSNDKIWQAVQDAVSDAGFETTTVHVLDKGQPSIKGVKGRLGLENVTSLDLMLCLKHKRRKRNKVATESPPVEFVDSTIKEALVNGRCRSDEIYSEVLKKAIESKFKVTGITMQGVATKCEQLGAVLKDDHWYVNGDLQDAVSMGTDFVGGYLTSKSKLPRSSNPRAPRKTIQAERIFGSRSSSFYLAHSYHTKVPPEAIVPFVDHFTKPGDVILDPFAGSGMTGVAASMSGRKSILSDLSPAACHLSWNHTRELDIVDLEAGFESLASKVETRIRKLYSTRHTDRSEATILWTMWSTKHKCPVCKKKFLLWDAVDRETGRIGKQVVCPNCDSTLQKSKLESLGSEPARIAYQLPSGRKFQKDPTYADKRRARSFSKSDIAEWYPRHKISGDREMYIRCALGLKNISDVSDFYTSRNLHALAIMWEAIHAECNDRVRRVLTFAFTNTAWHGTRMRRFNARGGQRPLTGTLYIPQLSSEANVFEVFRNKIKQLRKYYSNFDPTGEVEPAILLGSADQLEAVEDETIDYVFTDPPFGSNIFYADCNFIWESWLGRMTDTTKEAVVNKSLKPDNGGKTLLDYGDLMAGALREIHRVLKPRGWVTIVFHNTDAAVWHALHDAAVLAGFEFHEASTLDRKQKSHKGYKGDSGAEDVAHNDVIFNLKKSTSGSSRNTGTNTSDIDSIVKSITDNPKFSEDDVQGIHSEVMRKLASTKEASYFDFADIREAVTKLREKKV